VYYVPSSANTPPRSGRRIVTVWLANSGVDEVDRMAHAGGVTRSDMIRTLLAEAIQARRTGRR
jgi:metal-responsive CopG/Arc/MetJ family transcriptional regulator